MAGNTNQDAAIPSSVGRQLSQDSDSVDMDDGEIWNHRRLQQQVGYLSLSAGFSGELSPQPSSSAECERRVSPLDPNLSSAARYSPPPPYNSPLAGIEASLEHPDSPMEDLSSATSLPSLPAGVSSSISSATESLAVSEAHRLPRSSVGRASGSRGNSLVSANSLFASQPVLSCSQPRWASPDVISDDDEDEDVVTVSPSLGESVWAKQKRLALSNIVDSGVSQPGPSGLQIVSRASPSGLQSISQPGQSGLQVALQPCSSGIQTLPRPVPSNLGAMPQPSPSILQAVPSSHQALPQHQRSTSSDSDADDSNDVSENLPQLSSTPGPSSIRSRLVRLSDGEAEALNGAVSGCEASSSIRGHVSPLESPSTPTDNCIVSSSTGHIDSIPPTPAEFQGNDVSGPSSPLSPSLGSAAILDSTVDSTSGRGIMDPEGETSDDDSDNDNLAPTGQMQLSVMGERDEISTSEVGLQQSDDSEDVALLVSPQGMFSSGRASANRFIEQLSLSLSHFSGDALDANLSGVVNEQRSPPNTPPPDPGPYLNDALAIPGPSRASLPCSQTTSRQVSTPADQTRNQPSTSSTHSLTDPVEVLDSSLPLLDITSGLPGCSTVPVVDRLSNSGASGDLPSSVRIKNESRLGSGSGGLEPLVCLSSSTSNAIDNDSLTGNAESQDLNQLGQSYVLGLNDESSVGSENVLSSSSIIKHDLADSELQQRNFSSLSTGNQSLLVPKRLREETLNSSLNLSLASSEPNRVMETDVALPGPSQQPTLAHHLLPVQPDQVSLLDGSGDESSDGALLMMVSSNTRSIHNTLSLEKQLEHGEARSLVPSLQASESQFSIQSVQSTRVEGTSPSLSSEEPNSRSENEVNSSATGHEMEAEFIGADFWCGECEQMYAHECPHHHMQEESAESTRTRAWGHLPTQQLAIPERTSTEDCEECEEMCGHDCSHHHIQAISDKPVRTRAWASLPAQHLLIRKVPDTEDFGVFARKSIPKRTQFGPLEGIMKAEVSESPSGLVYTISSREEFAYLDTSDEDSSNWMRFVRKATTYLEQNCVVVQTDGSLFFLTTTDIAPRAELRVGYSKQYADERNLQTLEPTEEEIKILDSLKKSWPCYECDEGFESSAELQHHLTCHDEEVGEDDRKKRKRIKPRRPRGNGENEAGLKRTTKRIKVGEDGNSVAGTSEGGGGGSDSGLVENSAEHSQCMICSLVFTMPEMLRIHQYSHVRADIKQKDASTITLKDVDKTCPQCIKVFETEKELSSHVEDHGFFPPVQTKPYKCDFCYKSFSRRERLDVHTAIHGNEAQKAFRCNLCLRRFCSNLALNNHIKYHTDGSKGYDCPICREGFLSVASLKAHVSTHCVNGEYECPTCNKVFPTYSKIRRHIRSYHAVMPHTCSVCSKEMPSSDKLKIHMLSHSDRRDFLCPDCGKRFKRKDKLREHAKRMHLTDRDGRTIKPGGKAPPKFIPKVDPADYKQFVYRCNTCLLGFKRRGMLVNHLAKRHPSVDLTTIPELNQPILKATRCYYCQYCEKMYRSSSKRKLHILRYHPGAELPPPSTTHNKGESGVGPPFSQTVGATSTYPHPCRWCFRQYASRARLLRHQRHQHPELCANSPSHKDYASDLPESVVTDVDPLLETSPDLSGEPGTSGVEGTEDDLLTQAMGEITPLASGKQYVRLVATGTEGQQVVVGTTQAARPLLVSSDGGQQVGTLALVTAVSPDTVTLSLPTGQFISLIPGLSVTGTASTVTSTSRSIANGGSVNIHTVDAQEGVGSSGGLQAEGVP
nr:uncharacterized protein LOC123755358 isoform X2 [Procambarus clarkii]